MKSNSRSLCVVWFRFIKFISILFYGSVALNWVWNCSNGLLSMVRSLIYILVGEKVCSYIIRLA